MPGTILSESNPLLNPQDGVAKKAGTGNQRDLQTAASYVHDESNYWTQRKNVGEVLIGPYAAIGAFQLPLAGEPRNDVLVSSLIA